MNSLVGVTYKTWITPTKGHPELKTIRTGFGGWGDRVGALAYALTPLTIALCSRESVLSLITGIPYQHFNFLHRWIGRVIFIQSFLHTLVWTLVEGRFYQPQPDIYTSFIKQKYIVWGIVAQIMITFLYIFSTSWAIRWTGYEFFKKTHALIGILYLGACWGHWDKLACWMIASLIIVLGDFGIRFLRTALLHVGYRKGKPGLGYHSANATVQHYGDDEDSVVRIDFDFKQSAWKPGQHFYLCFPALNIWQSHPFTPSSLPDGRSDIQHHTYLIRERSGITAQLARIAKATGGDSCTTSVILTGPYGGSSTDEAASSNLLAVAGGTGVTSVLPTLQDTFTIAQTGILRAVDFVWVVRKIQDLAWITPELTELKSWMSSGKAGGLRMRIFVTRETAPLETTTSSTSSISEKGKGCCSKRAKGEKTGVVVSSSDDLAAPQNNFCITYLGGAHPSIKDIVAEFAERAAICGGRSQVIGAGPMEIGTALRSAVAKENHAGRVWQGDESGIMALEWDCRS
jgi:ferredoxin-NADP reductase